ncbi:sialate O-acetylesterase [Pedobacter sp. MR2016-24]|uniref:sialate O-acetylesterase n=1 Tax=Pedobacter sp. MR2016-24 TaxID=2994466 RepID=UPI0022483B3E|nr:sialate O-acetylesterase [Pedobacter sp. MR2016-24]MCX2486200.1 hypothetical protein [Pedobacter sp. MR2016-24]
MKKITNLTGLTAILLIFTALGARAQLRLPNYFSDHMVMQRNADLQIRGWAVPGEKIHLRLAQHNFQCIVQQDSTWTIKVPAFQAGGPYQLRVRSGKENKTIQDIYFGDVWFCSGQSNMSFRVDQAKDYDKEVKDASYPFIREFAVPLTTSLARQQDIGKSQWKMAGEGTIGSFSAVGWFFAKEVYKKNKIPIGIVHASWGGKPIEQFMGKDDLQAFPALTAKLSQLKLPLKNGYPTGIYNAMISPFFSYPVKGVLWYQGEANSDWPVCFGYEQLLKVMVQSWRKSWADPDLPFLLVQLANYNQKVTKVMPVSGWAIVQEAQYKVSKQLKNIGLVVTNDIGNPFDAHPVNKQEVGRRLAALAFHEVYGDRSVAAYGPAFRSAKILNGTIIASFDHVDGGIVAKDSVDTLRGFTIAGEDKKFYPARAIIRNREVTVSAREVARPMYLRYAFTDNPPPVNFYNRQGFPALPFRTDEQ